MKYVLSKEHFSYKILTLLMESSIYPRPLYGQPPPPYLHENLNHPFYDFSKISNPYKQGGSHYEEPFLSIYKK